MQVRAEDNLLDVDGLLIGSFEQHSCLVSNLKCLGKEWGGISEIQGRNSRRRKIEAFAVTTSPQGNFPQAGHDPIRFRRHELVRGKLSGRDCKAFRADGVGAGDVLGRIAND